MMHDDFGLEAETAIANDGVGYGIEMAFCAFANVVVGRRC